MTQKYGTKAPSTRGYLGIKDLPGAVFARETHFEI
jgi:hypothetical protein